MVKHTTVTLISDSPAVRGVFDAPSASAERTVYCSLRSVSMRESYEAMSHGLRPEWIIEIPHDFEYAGEKRCRLDGTEYRIIRTYVNSRDGIELTVERTNEVSA